MSSHDPMDEWCAGPFDDSDVAARARAQMRALREEAFRSRRTLVARGELVTAKVMAKALQISTLELRQAVLRGRMFQLEVDGKIYFPRFFADPAIGWRDFAAVCRTLGTISAWSKYVFFTTPKNSLGRLTPLVALKRFGLSRVLPAARGYRER